ncbi:hypothetical protein NQ314_017320 [Rhamnusium bicolor]|uniref:DUF4371 domain-containing protein n=1 Tax=Rhamnusium bicolor TaxID=1586634 RepID=A0AAV8WUM2_9CUCU|nr:hypothetical protein NQ314_017320 [Rhamnusium bicolor]
MDYSELLNTLKKSLISDEVKKAEMKIVVVVLEHNIPFRVMDHFSDVNAAIISRFRNRKLFSSKRTKSTAIAYNVLRKNFKTMMLEEIQSGPSTFSIIIDESTDVSTTKILAIKNFSNNSNSVKTKFLSIIIIKGITAQDLFDAPNSGLSDQGLNLLNMIGFVVDTTNVVFGKHAGIVAKMRDVNPHCIFVKSVCHSRYCFGCKQCLQNFA